MWLVHVEPAEIAKLMKDACSCGEVSMSTKRRKDANELSCQVPAPFLISHTLLHPLQPCSGHGNTELPREPSKYMVAHKGINHLAMIPLHQ